MFPSVVKKNPESLPNFTRQSRSEGRGIERHRNLAGWENEQLVESPSAPSILNAGVAEFARIQSG